MADSKAPNVRNCGTMEVHDRRLRTDPGYRRARIASENRHFQVRSFGMPAGRAGITVIPVVVHVIHKTAAQNIDDAQIQSQIDVLNRDFRRTNADIGSVPSVFAPLAADARIEFELAKTDPNGDPATGITRTSTSVTSFPHDDTMKSAATGGADPWPTDRYLNIWVCQLGGGLLGFAEFPGAPADVDGVVVLHSAFGTSGTAAAPFNLGRTTTHEIGHWLNLRHIWGDDGGGCNGDDFVADTPNAADANTGKPSFPHVTCNNGPDGDMFMNYMDYTDDDSMFMFTQGQVDRMQACLDSDRPTIGRQKPSLETLKFRDDPVTLKFRDDVVKPKFADDPVTLKFRDDGVKPKFADDPVTLKFRDDPATLKFRDDPVTIKFTDDGGGGTLKFRDDPATLKFRDDGGTVKFLDDGVQTGPGADVPFDPTGGGIGPDPAPFVLSTGHHSSAWTRSFPAAAQQAQQAQQAELAELEAVLTQYAQADEAGQLGDEDRAEAEQLHARYQQLAEQLGGQGG